MELLLLRAAVEGLVILAIIALSTVGVVHIWKNTHKPLPPSEEENFERMLAWHDEERKHHQTPDTE